MRDISSITGIKGLSAAAEYNGGSGIPGKTRLGVTYTPNFGKGNFTMVKIFPINIGAQKDAQLSFYSSQKINDYLSVNVLGDCNMDTGKIYKELGAEFKAFPRTIFFIQLRGTE